MVNNDNMLCKNTAPTGKKAIRASQLTAEQRSEDEKYMRRCLFLARQGRAGASPNPMVGAVVVCEGRIIGEGYHRCQGGPHAEVNAIASVRETEWLPQSTIYVSLEPCAHYGKTPPCADLIVNRGIRRCVVGCKDPFAKVDGLGIKKLEDAGVEVVVGVLEAECLALNHSFITYHTQRRPYITLKWAQSEDGLMGGLPGTPPVRLSSALTLTLMHRRRALSDAILVGGGTALADNPSLTVRKWTPRGLTGNLPQCARERGGNAEGHPLRVVIDAHANLPRELHLFDGQAETLVWPNWKLDELMQALHERSVQTLLVEGGAETLQRFLERGLWDELRVETAPVRLGEGVKAPSLDMLRPTELHEIGGHTIALYYR